MSATVESTTYGRRRELLLILGMEICVTDENCRFMIRVRRAVQMEIRGVWFIMSRRVGNGCVCCRAANCTKTLGIICDLTRCHVPEKLQL